MARNENRFKLQFEARFGVGHLRGKKRYTQTNTGNAVEISSDESLQSDDWLVLIEIDSFNTTKPAVGQYVLLNQLSPNDPSRTLFLVIHSYYGFNAGRTRKYLDFVSTTLPRQPAIRYAAFGEEEFWNLCQQHRDVGPLIRALTAATSTTPAGP